MMDHIVVLDSAANELEDLLNNYKSMILRSADTMKIPYGNVSSHDILYFVTSDCNNEVKAKAVVSSVFFSCRLSVEESFELIIRNQDKLVLQDVEFYKWAGKRYIVLVELEKVERIKTFRIKHEIFSGSDDWCLSGDIENSQDHKSNTNRKEQDGSPGKTSSFAKSTRFNF
jgi:hypothetical protein